MLGHQYIGASLRVRKIKIHVTFFSLIISFKREVTIFRLLSVIEYVMFKHQLWRENKRLVRAKVL